MEYRPAIRSKYQVQQYSVMDCPFKILLVVLCSSLNLSDIQTYLSALLVYTQRTPCIPSRPRFNHFWVYVRGIGLDAIIG